MKALAKSELKINLPEGRIMLKYSVPILFAASIVSVPAQADKLTKLYKDKTITVTIPYGPGGTYDKYGSSFTNHLGRHIPGKPNLIMQYMPGAGGAKAMNWFYNVAPKIGRNLMVPLDNTVVNKVLRPKKMRYDPNKFTWLGSSNQTNAVIVIRSDKGINNILDMRKIPAIGSTSGRNSSTYIFCALAAKLLNLKLKMVTGYKGSSRSIFAIEQGEVDLTAPNWLAWSSKVPHWFVGKTPFAKPILQNGYFKDPNLPNVPMLTDLVTPEQKPLASFLASAGVLGRGLVLPPGVPEYLVKPLRSAYDKMNADNKFLKELKKRKLRLMASTGEQVQKVVADAMRNTSPAVVAKVRKLVFGK
jgi:tripartite-type tricarboxylate transporter receptor subunit TctC